MYDIVYSMFFLRKTFFNEKLWAKFPLLVVFAMWKLKCIVFWVNPCETLMSLTKTSSSNENKSNFELIAFCFHFINSTLIAFKKHTVRSFFAQAFSNKLATFSRFPKEKLFILFSSSRVNNFFIWNGKFSTISFVRRVRKRKVFKFVVPNTHSIVLLVFQSFELVQCFWVRKKL